MVAGTSKCLISILLHMMPKFKTNFIITWYNIRILCNTHWLSKSKCKHCSKKPAVEKERFVQVYDQQKKKIISRAKLHESSSDEDSDDDAVIPMATAPAVADVDSTATAGAVVAPTTVDTGGMAVTGTNGTGVVGTATAGAVVIGAVVASTTVDTGVWQLWQ